MLQRAYVTCFPATSFGSSLGIGVSLPNKWIKLVSPLTPFTDFIFFFFFLFEDTFFFHYFDLFILLCIEQSPFKCFYVHVCAYLKLEYSFFCCCYFWSIEFPTILRIAHNQYLIWTLPVLHIDYSSLSFLLLVQVRSFSLVFASIKPILFPYLNKFISVN